MKKKIITTFCLALSSFVFSQEAFQGKGDSKLSVGFLGADKGSGINVIYDKGLGDNISVGLAANYLLGTSGNNKPDTFDRLDLKGRFNVNLNKVIGISNLDLYPGLNLGLHNFGMHLGTRYFFSDGLGVYTELDFPLAKYENYNVLENSLKFSLGVSLSL